MTPPVEINYLAVLVAAIISMVIGFLWYGPLFGKTWMKLASMSETQIKGAKKKRMTKLYIIAFIGTLVTSLVLAHFIDYTESTKIGDAFQAAFWIWLGFIAPLLLGSVLWEGKSLKLFFLNAIYNLVSLVIAAIILTAWV